jgi:hypothetical protein
MLFARTLALARWHRQARAQRAGAAMGFHGVPERFLASRVWKSMEIHGLARSPGLTVSNFHGARGDKEKPRIVKTRGVGVQTFQVVSGSSVSVRFTS